MAAKKITGTSRKVTQPVARSIPAAEVPKADVRNSPLPKAGPRPVAQATVSKQITREMIQQRAYEIWQREGGNEYDNWCRAERELRSV